MIHTRYCMGLKVPQVVLTPRQLNYQEYQAESGILILVDITTSAKENTSIQFRIHTLYPLFFAIFPNSEPEQ